MVVDAAAATVVIVIVEVVVVVVVVVIVIVVAVVSPNSDALPDGLRISPSTFLGENSCDEIFIFRKIKMLGKNSFLKKNGCGRIRLRFFENPQRFIYQVKLKNGENRFCVSCSNAKIKAQPGILEPRAL